MRRWLIILAAAVAVVWLQTALYTVDQGEYVLVARFGQMYAVHDGAADAGLHLKAPWPIDSVHRLDRRIQVVDLPLVESLTRDPGSGAVDKTLAVQAFALWRLPDSDAADRFFRTLRTPEQARAVLAPVINGRLAAVISALPMEEWVGVVDTQTALAGISGWAATVPNGPAFIELDQAAIERRLERLRQRWMAQAASPTSDGLAEQLRTAYGIELVEVRLLRFGYPPAVWSSIAERIRSERARKAADYETAGRQQAAAILAEAERQARAIEADAKARKTLIEGQAQAEAARIRAEAYAQDPEFYLFLENLRAFQTLIAESKDLLLLSTKHPLLRPLAGPPRSASGNPAGPATGPNGPGDPRPPASKRP